MQMAENEIRRNYAGAKNKSMQIGILADLNCCTKDRIREILGLIPYTESTVEIAEPDGNPVEKSVDKDAIMSKLYSTLDDLDREIKQLEKQYQDTAIAIKVVSQMQERSR